MPTPAFTAAAKKPDARPRLVFQFVGIPIYFASDDAHYPVAFSDGASEPHHDDLFVADGLPNIKRELPGKYYGRVTPALGDIKLVANILFGQYFSGYSTTMRGALINGYVTYAGLAAVDAVKFLTGRVQKMTSADNGDFTINLADATAETLNNAKAAALIYTAQPLGTLVKNILTASGLAYPADFDAPAWNAWTAVGQPGAYIVTGQYAEGGVWATIDRLLANTLSVYFINRSGKFTISQFADLGGSPAVDVDLDDYNSVYEGQNRTETFETILRAVTVKYNAGANTVTKTVNLLTSHPWWPTAKDQPEFDIGLTNVTDATSLATAWLTLLSCEHAITTIRTDARLMGFDVLQTVKLNVGDKKLPSLAPTYHRIIGIEEDYRTGGVVAKLWTNLGGPPLA